MRGISLKVLILAILTTLCIQPSNSLYLRFSQGSHTIQRILKVRNGAHDTTQHTGFAPDDPFLFMEGYDSKTQDIMREAVLLRETLMHAAHRTAVVRGAVLISVLVLAALCFYFGIRKLVKTTSATQAVVLPHDLIDQKNRKTHDLKRIEAMRRKHDVRLRAERRITMGIHDDQFGQELDSCSKEVGVKTKSKAKDNASKLNNQDRNSKNTPEANPDGYQVRADANITSARNGHPSGSALPSSRSHRGKHTEKHLKTHELDQVICSLNNFPGDDDRTMPY